MAMAYTTMVPASSRPAKRWNPATVIGVEG
jgi:hypothetical protein